MAGIIDHNVIEHIATYANVADFIICEYYYEWHIKRYPNVDSYVNLPKINMSIASNHCVIPIISFNPPRSPKFSSLAICGQYQFYNTMSVTMSGIIEMIPDAVNATVSRRMSYFTSSQIVDIITQGFQQMISTTPLQEEDVPTTEIHGRYRVPLMRREIMSCRFPAEVGVIKWYRSKIGSGYLRLESILRDIFGSKLCIGFQITKSDDNHTKFIDIFNYTHRAGYSTSHGFVNVDNRTAWTLHIKEALVNVTEKFHASIIQRITAIVDCPRIWECQFCEEFNDTLSSILGDAFVSA